MITAPSVDSIISRLRPRDVGGIIDQAFRLYRKHFWTFLAIVAVVYLPVQLLIQGLTLFLLGPVYRLSSGSGTDFTTRESSVNNVFTGLFIYFGAILVLSLLGAVLEYLSQGALTAGVADSHLDRPVSLGNSYREMLTKVGSLLGYMFLQVLIFIGIGIIVFVPFLPLAFSNGATGGASVLACLAACLMIPAIILGFFIYIRLAVAVPAIMVEGLSPVEAFRRSWRLVENYWWRTLGLTLLLGVIALVISAGPSSIISALVRVVLPLDPITGQAISGLVGVLTSTFFIPLQFIAITLYYFDLRVRKEGFDIDAAMSQAYPQYGGYGTYGQGEVASGQYGYGQAQQASPMHPPMLGYEQQGAGQNYAPAQPAGQYTGNPAGGYNPTPAPQGAWPTPQAPTTQETVDSGAVPGTVSPQPAPEQASGTINTPYGNDPLGLYPSTEGQETPQGPVSGETGPGQEDDNTQDVDRKES